jgi:hypothetical protein
MFDALLIRWGWYQHRKYEGHPISLRRAMFSCIPRFGAYEECEAGCTPEAKRDYALVRKYEAEGHE